MMSVGGTLLSLSFCIIVFSCALVREPSLLVESSLVCHSLHYLAESLK